MTTTDQPTEAFTYKATVREGNGMDISRGAKFVKTVQGVVMRSDGKTVFVGSSYIDRGSARKAAQGQANMQVGRFRAYLKRNGECWWDRRQTRLAWEKARDGVRKGAARELMDAASAGTRAAEAGEAEATCPFSADTAQGVVWTQAFRLATDRMADWLAENPKPPQE